MTGSSSVQDLLRTLENTEDLIKDYAGEATDLLSLPSLLQQCEALAAQKPEPIRSIHHFACSGGTLISKLLATMPNVTLLSEIDPLSPDQMVLGALTAPRFQPTDVLYAARFATRPIDPDAIAVVFKASVKALHSEVCARGGSLVLRDHAHSQFCSHTQSDQRPTLRKLLQDIGDVKSVTTVRHPLDSFLSLSGNGWHHFLPFTLEEYAKRYETFLSHYSDVPTFRYEDFIAAPEQVLQQICETLDLPFEGGTEIFLPLLNMSGDSGRSSDKIEVRPRRDVPENIRRQAENCPAYERLCAALGYSPSVDKTP